MDRRVLWTVMLILGTALTVSCGDDGGDDGGKAGTNGGNAGTTGGDPEKVVCDAPGLTCGLNCCTMAAGSTIAPCCADEFDGVCGMSVSAFGGTPACVREVPSVAGCPTLTIPVINFQIPSCCTPEKMCGLDASVFGMGGCTELGEAAERAMQMFMMGQMSGAGAGGSSGSSGSDEDGGVAGAGGMSGGAGAAGRAGGGRGIMLPMFPAPQACPN